MTIDWNEAAVGLKREVCDHGGFLTISKDALRERFGIGRLRKENTEELLTTLRKHGMIVCPHPYHVQGISLRVYDVKSEIGKIALAVIDPQGVTERALVDAVALLERADAGPPWRSVSVPWLSALDVFLQLVFGRPPEAWEVLDDDREHFQLVEALAASLDLPAGIADARETIHIAGAVWAYRPRVFQWEGGPPALGAALAKAAEKQKEIYDGMLRDAAKYMLGGAEIPSRDVDLGRLGLRYRHEAKGGIA